MYMCLNMCTLNVKELEVKVTIIPVIHEALEVLK